MLVLTLYLPCVITNLNTQKINRVNKNMRALNKCNHCLSRKGYIGLMKEIVSVLNI